MQHLFKATVKRDLKINGITLLKGMEVEFLYNGMVPLGNTEGHQVIIDAFKRKYGVDIKKAQATSSIYLQIDKIR